MGNPTARPLPDASTLWQETFGAYALVERYPKLLALIHEAFVGLEVGVIFCHRILAEIALALLVKPPADISQRLDSL